MSIYQTSFIFMFWIITIVFLWEHGFVGGTPYVGIVGGDAYLNWTIHNLIDEFPRFIRNPRDNASLMLFFRNTTIPYIIDNRTTFTGDILRGVVSFTLSNVKVSDAGRYTFQMETGNGTLILGGQGLIVAESPDSPVIKALSLVAAIEKEYKLNCSTQSRTAPLDHTLNMYSYWKQNGVNISLESRYIVNGTILTINNLSRMDNGEKFTCHAFEDQRVVSSGSSAFVLNVLYGPDNVHVTPSGTLNVTEGGNMNLTCTAECNPPCSNYNWSKGLMLTIDGSSQSYWLPEVTRNQSGIYTCTVTNTNISKSATAQITVMVNYPPVVSINSQNGTCNNTDIALTCSGIGVPGQYVFMLTHSSLFTGIMIRHPRFDYVSTSVIHYRFSSFMDTGIYTCTVNNGIADYKDGSVNKSVSETVWIKGPPIVTSSITSFHAEKGQSGRLSIEFYNSLLDPSVTWYRDRNQSLEKLDSSDKYRISVSNVSVILNFYSVSIHQPGFRAALDIRNVTPDDFGSYQVNVQNSVGVISPGVLILRPRDNKEGNMFGNGSDNVIIGSAVGAVVLIGFAVVIGVVIFKRRRMPKLNADGLVDNTLYYSTECSNDEYAAVSKPKLESSKKDDLASLYAQVDKTKKTGKIGEIYENVKMVGRSSKQENLHENSRSAKARVTVDNVYENPETSTHNDHLAKGDQLMYADIVLNPPMNRNGKPVIIGEDNKIEYAEIAYTNSGKPPPNSDHEKTVMIQSRRLANEY